MEQFDLLVIGGGINGTAIAADAAGRGLSVLLSEKDDLSAHTSSASSKLIHGGLRYLEQYEFRLVREALKEREILLKKAPHLIQPLTFVLPHDKHLRPAWMIRLGLFLYDHLSRRQALKKSTRISLRHTPEGQPLKEQYKIGFTYSDCRVDDARLVIATAQAATLQGATILTHTRCLSAVREQQYWRVTLPHKIIYAKAIVNAAGPWVSDVLHQTLHSKSKSDVKWVKGSHIVIPKLYEGDHAYILQNKDHRIVFAIPYGFNHSHENRYTLIGTTDIDYHGDLEQVTISDIEIDYLCRIINEYFIRTIKPTDVIWSYAGVRPLYDDHADNPSKVTREYHFELEDDQGRLPILSVFGGKITTHRILAEHALTKLSPYFPHLKNAWTAHTPLPGGDIISLEVCTAELKKQFPFLPDTLAYRYAAAYGSRAFLFLQHCTSLTDLGKHFGAGLYEKEVRSLIDTEWAKDVVGIVWLRSKLGLQLTATELHQLELYLTTAIK